MTAIAETLQRQTPVILVPGGKEMVGIIGSEVKALYQGVVKSISTLVENSSLPPDYSIADIVEVCKPRYGDVIANHNFALDAGILISAMEQAVKEDSPALIEDAVLDILYAGVGSNAADKPIVKDKAGSDQSASGGTNNGDGKKPKKPEGDGTSTARTDGEPPTTLNIDDLPRIPDEETDPSGASPLPGIDDTNADSLLEPEVDEVIVPNNNVLAMKKTLTGCLGIVLSPILGTISLIKKTTNLIWQDIRPSVLKRAKLTTNEVTRKKNRLPIIAIALVIIAYLEIQDHINFIPENINIQDPVTAQADLQAQRYEANILSAENYQSLPDWTRNDIQSANYTNALRRSLTNPMLSKAIETEEGVTTTVPRDEYSKEGALEVLKLFQNAGVPDVAQGLPYSSNQIFRNQAMLESLQDFGNSQAVANSLPIQQTTEGAINGAELWYEAQKLAQEFSEMIDNSQWVDGGTRAVFDIDKERHAHWQRVVDGIIENQRLIESYVGSFSE